MKAFANAFEKVHTMTDYYDGPRKGIADFAGQPHFFESELNDDNDDAFPIFLLSPITDEIFQLSLEDWSIWRRWETAFYEGKATQESHPALPEDRSRHEEIRRMLDGRLVIHQVAAFRARGEFRVGEDPSWSGKGVIASTGGRLTKR